MTVTTFETITLSLTIEQVKALLTSDNHTVDMGWLTESDTTAGEYQLVDEDEYLTAIPGYEFLYSVTPSGRVYSHERVVVRSDGKEYTVKGRWLKGVPDPNGYLTVVLSKDGTRTKYRLHRLVTLAFLGKLPSGLETRHLDGYKLNNHIRNLRYGTHADNTTDRTLHGTVAKGERVGTSKLTPEQVLEIRSLYTNKHENGLTQHKLASMFGVSHSLVSLIINRKSWTHI
jgi:hypothetical protein